MDHTYQNQLTDIFEAGLAENNTDDVGEFVDTLDELVIACVQGYTHLYNKNDNNYKNHLMKEKSWEEIATTCNVSMDEIQQRWKRLKERYTKERRLNEKTTRSGSAMNTNKRWPFFDSMKFMDKHIQRRRVFTNVASPSNANLQKTREDVAILQRNPNVVQMHQEVKNVQMSLPESNRMERQPLKRYVENTAETSERGLSGSWQNFEPSTSNSYKSSTGVYQPSMSFRHASTSDTSTSSAHLTVSTAKEETTSEHITMSAQQTLENHRRHSSQNELDASHSANDDISVAIASAAVTSSLPTIPTKCFSGGIQRKTKNKPDVLETSFINTANILKDYLLAKQGEKENMSSADEHLAKFIVSRLSQLPEENRDEIRKKLIEVLLSK